VVVVIGYSDAKLSRCDLYWWILKWTTRVLHLLRPICVIVGIGNVAMQKLLLYSNKSGFWHVQTFE